MDLVQWVCDLVNTVFDDSHTDEHQYDRLRQRIKNALESESPEEANLVFFVNTEEEIDVDYVAPPDEPGALCFYVAKQNPSQPISTTQELSHGTFVASNDVLDRIKLQLWGRSPVEVTDLAADALTDSSSLQGHLPVPQAAFVADCEAAVERPAGACCSGSSYPVTKLESYLDRWTEIIEKSLKTFDADNMHEEMTGDKGPLQDISFWEQKAKVMDTIYKQLQGKSIRRVLRCLDRARTQKNYQFANTCKVLFTARAEARSNERFLRPLKGFLEELQGEAELSSVPQHFVPIFHVMSLVWKSSDHFQTKPRLVGLLKKLCWTVNEISHRHLSSGLPITYRPKSEATDAIRKAKQVVQVLGKLKATFSTYKRNSYTNCPSNPWDIADDVIFSEVNTVLNRCHEMIELYTMSLQFSVLRGLVFGGRRGIMLTSACNHLHLSFVHAFNKLEAVTQDSLPPSQPNDLYELKSFVKELDLRVHKIICLGLDDSNHLEGKLRLLSLFGDIVVERSLLFEPTITIVEELAAIFVDEIDFLGRIFERGCSTTSTMLRRMPPTASAVMWSRGLLDRMRSSMAVLQTLDDRLLQGSICRKVIRQFVRLEGKVADYEQNAVARLHTDLGDPLLQDKLHTPILEKDADSAPLAIFRIHLDPVCARLMEESLYGWLGLGLHPANNLFHRLWSEIRDNYERIALVVNLYNRIERTLQPVERPLVLSQMKNLSTTLSSGSAIEWTSDELAALCQKSEAALRALLDALASVHTNHAVLKHCIGSVRERLLFEPPPGLLPIADASLFVVNSWKTAVKKNRAAAAEIEATLQRIHDATKPRDGDEWSSFQMLIKKGLDGALVASIELSLKKLESSLDGSWSIILRSKAIGDNRAPELGSAVRQWVSMILRTFDICADSSNSLHCAELLSSPKTNSLLAKIMTRM